MIYQKFSLNFQNQNNLKEEHFAEHFHQDSYLMTYSKIHVNLMDVTEDDGPLEIIPIENRSAFIKSFNYKDRYNYNFFGDKKLIKKIPKVGKTVSGIESLKGAIGKIMNRFGEDAITTADKVDQPEKTTQQLISEFESRNKPDAIKIESREILDVPPVPSGFKLSKEKLMTKFPELDEDFANDIMDMDKDTQGRIIKMLENRRLDPEAYDRLLAEYGDTLEFQAEFDKVTRRKNNNQGGLNYLMGL